MVGGIPFQGEASGSGAGAEDGEPLLECLVPAGCDWPIVLGIDPGTQAVGYGAVVVAPAGLRMLLCGTLRPPRGLDVPRRLDRIRHGLEQVLARCRPTVVAVERAFAHRNVHSALRIGEGRGVVLACAARTGAEVVEYSPAAAKKSIVGNGRASKEQVGYMVARLLGLEELSVAHDATDALSLALAHVRRMQLPYPPTR